MHERLTRLVALLLLGSGFSALAYQIVWTRQLRLVFGLQGGLARAAELWADPATVPRTLRQLLLAAEALAERADPRAAELVAALPPSRTADQAAVLARLHLRHGDAGAASVAALAYFERAAPPDAEYRALRERCLGRSSPRPSGTP